VLCPEELTINLTVTLLVILFLGGVGSLRGVLIGAVLFTALPEVLRVAPTWRLVIYGTLLLAVDPRVTVGVLNVPGGSIPEIARLSPVFRPFLRERSGRVTGYFLIGMPGLSRTGVVDFLVVFIALSTLGWAGLARLVRGQVLSLKEKDFVEAARAIGASPLRIISRHILPNTIGVLLVAVSMGMGGAIMGESVLSFLGLGIKPPNPSWGAMIEEEYRFWRTHAHLVFVPGGIVALVIFAFNFLGDGLNDAFNPRAE